jgi:hypothetical protein
MSDEALKKYVNTLGKERAVIKNKMNELDQKRRAYITSKQQESAKENELESVILKAIKKQAIKKNYKW